jgi:acetyl-CoA decarbonylase/synthase complex subunit gamma
MLGRWRARLGIGRGRYSMAPGLYKVGTPESLSPILVTANYKLTVDALRSALDGVDAWILVLDTKGVNVWCAAGKGTFSTDELVRQVQSTGLSEIVSHRKLVVPQLGAPGIAAHEVRRICGFKVVYGPVRARDIKAYLEAAMDATDDMRRVTFGLGERVEVIGVELTAVLKWIVPIFAVMVLLAGGESFLDRVRAVMLTASPILVGVLAGVVLVPILLPWIPGRAFSLKGAGLSPSAPLWRSRRQVTRLPSISSFSSSAPPLLRSWRCSSRVRPHSPRHRVSSGR